MKHTPIENPKLVGCLNCSPVPSKTLDKRHKWFIYGMIALRVDGKTVASWIDKTPMVQSIERRYAKEIREAKECVLLESRTPLHGEVYERNSEDGQWYLVEQNGGYA